MAKTYPNRLPLYNVSRLRKFREYSDGDRIGGGLKFRPAPYLPVKKFDDVLNKGIVIEAGDFVTLDEYGFLVPQFVGEKTLEYSAYDVTEGVFDIDKFATTKDRVTSAKTSTKTIGTKTTSDVKIGKPIGVAMFDVYAWDMDEDPWYQVQTEATVLCDRMILLAVDQAHNNVNYQAGDILVLDETGHVKPFDPTKPEELVYGVGRLVKVIDLNADPSWSAGIENVEYFPEEFVTSGLTGKPTNGVVDGMDPTTKKSLVIQLWF